MPAQSGLSPLLRDGWRPPATTLRVAQRAKVKAKKEEWVELEDMSGKGHSYMPCRLFLDADGYLPCRLNGNFLRIDPDWLPECYVRAQGSVSAVPGKRDYRVDDPNLAALIKLYIGNFPITLYRGVARWNPTWNYVSQRQPMRPIGNDAMPDYTSPNATTSFLPFSPDLSAASVFAKRPQGDRAGEAIELVEGYDPKDASYEVGRVVKVTVTRQQAVAFCDYAEVQVRGPLSYGSGNGQYNDALIIRMGTLRSQLPGQVMAPGMKDVAVAAMMPDALPAEELGKAKKEDRLLNRPGVLPAVSAVAVRSPLSALLSDS